ncbi:Hpt domain-containing protein [bacterium]|nr:Hpt domain-containing protein [bacterium]
MDMSKYKGMFIEESREHLKNINALVLDLEKAPDNKASINTLFREFHSIKGMAASMGYSPIMEMSHSLEDLLDIARKKEVSLSKSALSVIFAGTDALESMVEDIAADREIQDPHQAMLEQVRHQEQTLKSGITEAQDTTVEEGLTSLESGEDEILEAQIVDGEAPDNPAKTPKTTQKKKN